MKHNGLMAILAGIALAATPAIPGYKRSEFNALKHTPSPVQKASDGLEVDE